MIQRHPSLLTPAWKLAKSQTRALKNIYGPSSAANYKSGGMSNSHLGGGGGPVMRSKTFPHFASLCP